jgi:hypothetical protein
VGHLWEIKMLSPEHQKVLMIACERYKVTKDPEDLNKGIELVRILASEKFFHGDDDPRLKDRVFFNEPYSAHWSGSYVKRYGAK